MKPCVYEVTVVCFNVPTEKREAVSTALRDCWRPLLRVRLEGTIDVELSARGGLKVSGEGIARRLANAVPGYRVSVRTTRLLRQPPEEFYFPEDRT